MPITSAPSSRAELVAYSLAAGVAVGSALTYLLERVRQQSKPQPTVAADSDTTANTATAATTTPASASPIRRPSTLQRTALPTTKSSPVARRRSVLEHVSPSAACVALAQMSESEKDAEINGLLSILRTKEEALAALETERSTHVSTMRQLFSEIQDVKSMRDKVVEMQNRIRELEEAAATNQNGAAASSSSSATSPRPREYPLSQPLTSKLPAHFHNNPDVAVLFDLDGTLVESKQIWYELLNALSKHLGYGELEYAKWEPTYGQSMAANRDLFYPNHTQKEIDDYCDDHYSDFVHHLQILPGAIDALKETEKFLQAAGGKERMLINTNCPSKITQIILTHVPALKEFFIDPLEPTRRVKCTGTIVRVPTADGQVPAFDYSVSEKEVLEHHSSNHSNGGKKGKKKQESHVDYFVQSKPSTDVITWSCATIGARPENCLFIGDSKFDLMASMKAGCLAIGVAEKGRGGHMHIDNIGQLVHTLRQ